MDKESMLPISDVRISLYELVGTTAKLLSSKKIAQSNYRFQILPNKKLRLVAEKAGYLKNTYDFDSYNSDSTIEYTHIFSLNKRTAGSILVDRPSEQTSHQTADYTASVGTNDNIVATTKPTNSNSSPARRNTRNTASASISVGGNSTVSEKEAIYKVQVVAVNAVSYTHLTLPTICSV